MATITEQEIRQQMTDTINKLADLQDSLKSESDILWQKSRRTKQQNETLKFITDSQNQIIQTLKALGLQGLDFLERSGEVDDLIRQMKDINKGLKDVSDNITWLQKMGDTLDAIVGLLTKIAAGLIALGI